MERMEREEYHKLEIGAYNQNRCLFRVLEPYVGLLLHTKTGSLACIRQFEHDAPNTVAR